MTIKSSDALIRKYDSVFAMLFCGRLLMTFRSVILEVDVSSHVKSIIWKFA